MTRIDRADCKLGQTSDPIQTPKSIRPTETARALQELIQQHDDPARLLECYYWSKEPGLLECIRAILAAPAEVRVVLQAFFAAAIVREQISASIDEEGTLNLSSPQAATILTRFFRDFSTGIPPKHCC